MNQRIASLAAFAFCILVFAAVTIFGWHLYRKTQANNEAFSRALIDSQQDQNSTLLKARMPTQLPPRASTVMVEAGSSPASSTP